MRTIITFILAIALCAFANSCKSTKSVTSTEAARNATEQVQRRSERSVAVDSLWRFTALSIDSLTIVFEGADSSATHEDKHSACPTSYASSVNKATPSKVHLYGIHLSQEEKKNAVAEQCLSDSNAVSVQSSLDKSQKYSKATPSFSFKAIALCMVLIASAIIAFLLRNKLRK